MDVTEEWFWEGNVVDTVAHFLAQNGWTIISKANTRIKERGVDIHASKDGRTLLVEVKGYPSKTYRDQRRAGEIKLTNPINQAQHWYSQGLLKAMRLQTEHPKTMVALAFPDFPRYRALFEETQAGIAKLGVAMLFAHADGTVTTWGLQG